MKLRKKILIFISIIILEVILLTGILLIPCTTRQGVNFQVSTKKIPLYVKLSGFLERDYYYKEILNGLIKPKMTDEEKVLQIFNWAHKNIRPVPEGFPIVDDHILNIIIRGYGTPDQSADVFCNLCEYAGFPAKWAFIRAPGHQQSIVLSFVSLEGKERVFDTYNANYFINRSNELATSEDIMGDYSLVDHAKNKPQIEGIEYKEYFKGLRDLKESDFWKRGRAQMPLRRIIYELKERLF